MAELTQPRTHTAGYRPRPVIIELLNLADFTHQVGACRLHRCCVDCAHNQDNMLQVQCQVPVDEPIFQPFPPEVMFHSYEPFKIYEASLYLRNNDTVGSQLGAMRSCMVVRMAA